MKIGICVYPLSKGKETGRGLERVIEEFCAYLSKNNIPFDFYDNGIIRSDLKVLFFSFKYLLNLGKTKNNCYFSFYGVSGVFPILIGKRPLVNIVTDMIPFNVKGYDAFLHYSIKRWCIKYSALKSDRLIVGSSSIKNEVINRFKISPDKITIVPWGVNHETYYPNNQVKKIKNQVAFLGEARRAKGIDSLIKAFKYVLEKVPDATLSLASNGHEIEEMKELAAQTLPPNAYSFEGFILEEKMNEFYNTAELFIFPSRYGFGLSALEAMACGIPTLVGNTLDAKDFFTDNDLLVDPDDEKQIAQKLIYLLQNEEVKKQKSEQAIKISSDFSWEEMSKKYFEVCLKAINP